MSYPVIYAETATDFFNLGLGTLPDATKVEVTEERNGEFTLSMTYLVDGLRANEIKKNRIIKVDAGHVLKDQRFVIKKINRQLVDKQLQLQVYAEHVSYITNDLQLKPNVTVNGSGDAAIKAWRSNIIDVNPLVVDSDIETNTSTTWTIDKVQSARRALGGVTGSLLDLWGGEYRFDNYHISLKKQRGTVANTLLSYGRNITDFDQEENITDTYTTVYPYATYTETTTTDDNASSESKLMTLPELTVDSEYVGNYPNRKILPVDLTSKFTDNEKPTIEKLREYAKAYVKSNSIGIPTVSIKLSYVDLSQSSNYEALKLLEVLDLCDTVPVRFSKLGVDTKTKVSRVVWDVLAEHYTSMELGDTRYTIGDMINNALNTANEANQNSQEAQNSANHAVVSADGHTMIFYGPNTPVAKNVGDLWYQPDGEYETMYRWDGVTWAFVMSTRDTADAQKAADAAKKEAEEAKKTANESVAAADDAVGKANQAVEDAGFANSTASDAKTAAANAQKDATGALSDAQNALNNSSSAMVDSAQARKDSAAAAADASSAIAKANSTASEFGRVDQNAGSALASALSAQSDASAAVIQASSAVADSKDAKQIAGSVSQSYKTLTDGSTMTIAELESGLAAKLTKTDLDGYSTQTWTQNQIKFSADGINSTLSSVKTTVDGQTTSINDLKADSSSFKSQFTTVNNTLGKQTTDIGTLQATSKELTTGFNTLTTDNTTNKNDISQLKQTATELNSTMTTVQTQVQNSAVGTNLLRNSRGKFQPNLSKTDNYGIYDLMGVSVYMTQGQQYTVHANASSGLIWSGTHNPSVTSNNIVLWLVDNANVNTIISDANTGMSTTFTWNNPSGTYYLRVNTYNPDNSGYAENVKIEKGSLATDWCPNPADNATVTAFSKLSQTVNGIQTTVSGKADQSQITQLAGQITSVVGDVSANSSQITQMKADINLRVQKGDVVNQINISPEGILIDGKKVHITGQTTIDNAVIKDAMIADIKADKITAGTLNAANVNVINLNANNITTGTLKGTNLSMNLNTGEVLFQKGSIKSANGNLNLDISKGTMAVINEYKSGFYFEDGKLVLNDGWLEGTSSQPKYGSLEYNANYFTVNGLAVKGTEGVTIGTPGYNPSMEMMFSSVKESGIAIDRKHLEMGSVGPTIISSGNEFFMNLLTKQPFIAVGTTADGNFMTTDKPGSRISLYAEYVHIKSAYSHTASGSANLIVAEDGALVRSTSASKYKTDIIRTNIPDYGEKLLELPTATWTDIAETKRYRDDPVNQIKPTRNFGMIAEDLADAGLEMLVVRGTDGELEGINYDRIGPALIPVIAKLKNKIEKLEQKLEEPV